MRLVVLGGWGQLGSDIAAAAEGRHEIVRPRHADLDVTDGDALASVLGKVRPDSVINAAAFHKVELCETDPARAYAVNALGALLVARAARAIGARSVYISTDYVFDGEQRQGYAEDEGVGPLNAYGLSKAAGEAAVHQADPDALVVRGSALFGHAGSAGKGGNFVDNMITRARSGQPLAVVDDQVFAPTATRDLAERILQLLEHEAPPGTYHGANAGSCSWFELARFAIQLAGVDAEISPRATADDEPVRRPRYSVLLDTKAVALGLSPARSWQDALAWYLANRPAVVVAGNTA
jgi:dTDP-4-dehydrorhamnose reductase